MESISKISLRIDEKLFRGVVAPCEYGLSTVNNDTFLSCMVGETTVYTISFKVQILRLKTVVTVIHGSTNSPITNGEHKKSKSYFLPLGG
jgi:hypothetical protein